MTTFDEDALRRLHAYFGRDPRTPREVQAEALSEYGATEWALDEFLTAVREAIDTIPASCRAAAKVELDGGGDEEPRLTIRYTRMETSDEVAANVERGIAYVREQQARERATYEALKRKFEG